MRIPDTGRIGDFSLRSVPPGFSGAGLRYAQVLILLVLPGVLVFMYAWGYDQRSVGLTVHLLRADSFGGQGGSCAEAWAVRIDSEENWYLNSQTLSPTELPALLSEQFRLRTNCVVLVDADAEVPYAVAIHAIELVQETHAMVVLVTPGTKKIHVP